MSEAITLFGENLWISPYFFSSFVSLREKGVAFSVVELVLYEGATRKPEFRDSSLTAKVSAIRHGDFWLAESSAVAEYLEESFQGPPPRRLFPESVRERARARQLMAWFRSDLVALRDERPTTTMFFDRASAPLTVAGEKSASELIRVASLVVPDGSGSLFGEWTLVDSELAFMLHRLLLNGHAVPDKVRAFAEREWQRPSVREFIEHPRSTTALESYYRFFGGAPSKR
jgi:glutathione S-transferase